MISSCRETLKYLKVTASSACGLIFLKSSIKVSYFNPSPSVHTLFYLWLHIIFDISSSMRMFSLFPKKEKRKHTLNTYKYSHHKYRNKAIYLLKVMLCICENFRSSRQGCSIKRCSYKFRKIHRKTLVLEFLFLIKLQA